MHEPSLQIPVTGADASWWGWVFCLTAKLECQAIKKEYQSQDCMTLTSIDVSMTLSGQHAYLLQPGYVCTISPTLSMPSPGWMVNFSFLQQQLGKQLVKQQPWQHGPALKLTPSFVAVQCFDEITRCIRKVRLNSHWMACSFNITEQMRGVCEAS